MAKHYRSPAHVGQVIRQKGGADTEFNGEGNRRNTLKKVALVIKLTILVSIWLFCVICIIRTEPFKDRKLILALEPQIDQTIEVSDKPRSNVIGVFLEGDIDSDATLYAINARSEQPYMLVSVQIFDPSTNATKTISKVWKVYLADEHTQVTPDFTTEYIKLDESEIKSLKFKSSEDDQMLRLSLLNMGSNLTIVDMIMSANPINVKTGAYCGIFLLLFQSVLIAFDIVDQTLAAILTSTTGVAILCALGEKRDISYIISWIDIETIMLLFSMMMMVSILSETGIFEYLSIFVYKLSKGNAWLLMLYLCLLTGILAAIIDNITTVLIILPITIQLWEPLELNGPLVIIIIALFSNIGGALTPIGGPPSMIVSTDSYSVYQGIHFANFILHMFPGVLVSFICGFFVVYLLKRNKLTREGEFQAQGSSRLRNFLAYLKPPPTGSVDTFNARLTEMKEQLKFKNLPLLIKCGISFLVAIILFFLNSGPRLEGLTLAWAALLPTVLLLILVNKRDIDPMLDLIDWSTLVLFAALFVLTESLARMGFIAWLGNLIIDAIESVNKEQQLLVSILIIAWIAAFGAALFGNILITAMMLKLITEISEDRTLNLPFTPMAWSLLFGACFGGNGSLIGSVANVLASGLARQHGHPVTFCRFFILGFPVMLTTMILATIYLLIAHCAGSWH